MRPPRPVQPWRHVAADLAAAHVLQLQQQLRDLEQARQDDRVRLAREVFDLLSRLGAGMELEGWGQLAELFGQGHRVGELVTLGNPDRTRTARRATMRNVRAA